MNDADDPIPTRTPEDTILFRDAFDVVYRALNPDWQNLEERLNPSSPYYDAFHERDEKDRAYGEADRTYDKAQRLANEWLRERISQGVLVALISDPDTGQVFQLNRHKWASIGVFETGIASNTFGPHELQSGPNTIIKGGRRPVFFDLKSFDNVVKEIAQPATGISKPPVTDKGGRPPEYDWAAIKAFTLKLIAVRGKPDRNNKFLPSKAQLIEATQKEWSDRYDQHPADFVIESPAQTMARRDGRKLTETQFSTVSDGFWPTSPPQIRHFPPTFAETRKAEHQMKSDIPIEPEALSIEQACAFTGLGKTKIYELIGSRALKTRRLGRRRLVLRRDLQEFLETLSE